MKISERILHLFVFLILFTPLLVVSGMFFPFVAPKMLALEALTLLAGIVWLYLWHKNPLKYEPRVTWLGLALLGYGGVMFCAAVFGINFWRSFWSVYERMDGVFTWFTFVLLFFILSALYKKREDWVWIFRVSLLASIILELKAVNFFVAPEGGLALPTYVSGSFGNPLFLAIYAIAHAVIAVLLCWFLNPPLERRSDLRTFLKNRWVWFYGFGFFLNVLTLTRTTGRGPMAGFLFGIIVFSILYGFYAKQTQKRFLKGVGIALIVLALTFPLWRNGDTFYRIGSIGFHTSPDRLINWKIALRAFESRPLLGWGSNNYGIAQNEFYNPHLSSITQEGFDRTHNKYLEVAVDGGILGIVSYAAIFAVVVVALLARRKKEPFLSALLTGFFAAYLLQNITVFDSAGSYLPFFLFFAFISGEFLLPLRFRPKPKSWLVVGGWLFLGAFFWQGVWQPYAANKVFARALLLSGRQSPPYQEIMDGYKEALSYQTFGDHEMRNRLGAFLASQQSPPAAFLDFGISELQKEIAMSPEEVLLRVLLGKLYEKKAVPRLPDEKENLAKAEESLLKAIALSPARTESRQHYIVFLVDHNQEEKARNEAEKIKALDAEIYQGQLVQTYVAFSYYMEGNMAKTYDILHDIINHGGGFSSERDLLLLTRVTFELGKRDEMVHWYEKLVDTYKDNPVYRMYLAAAYKEVGKKEYAKNEALNAVRLDPKLQHDADVFIKSL